MTPARMRRAGTSTLLLFVALGALIAASSVIVTSARSDRTSQTAALQPTSTVSSPSPPPSPSSTTSEPPPPPVDPCAEKIAALPLRARLAQLLVVGVDPRGPADALSVVRAEQVGGIFIGGDDVGLLSAGALAPVHAAAALPLTVAVDDEGGRVQRLDALAGSMPSARRMAADLSPDQVRVVARDRGQVLRERGVTTDLAPVLDTSGQPDRTVIGDRSFSPDPNTALGYALAFAQGLHDAGVTPVVKHFPGHGNTTGDSHLGAVTSPPLDALLGADLLPYRQLPRFGQVVVMLGHIDVPGLTDGVPATLSPAAYALLRGEFGFTGPAMTDDLGAMRAVTDRVGLPDAVTQALAAGADIALWSSGGRVSEVLTHLEGAVASGVLPTARVDEAIHRVLTAKQVC
ncbi:glycoside hydrolase family 3 protein [Saccharothrix sp. S26]|uniref:glycoside hydrolase family 3 N-terminal domain-containing protein n=1 Tax=Saccharothrix sp. S26 TaxID=2907215 RepID=UPI001F285FCB|nr:glycoside hydrolase family 3 N-terminal domain-containing protein [Saccharothrix sp. S26]MCE6998165.1 glycoside hydrolase family 3 protein [Saccharothrix sp. S26]